jgi:hypothetical protein
VTSPTVTRTAALAGLLDVYANDQERHGSGEPLNAALARDVSVLLRQQEHDLAAARGELRVYRAGLRAIAGADEKAAPDIREAFLGFVEASPDAHQLFPVIAPLFELVCSGVVKNFASSAFRHQGRAWSLVLQPADGDPPTAVLGRLRDALRGALRLLHEAGVGGRGDVEAWRTLAGSVVEGERP